MLLTTDGPFAETKEQLDGVLIEVRVSDAIGVAAKLPPARLGSIEVRPIAEMAHAEPRQRRSCP